MKKGMHILWLIILVVVFLVVNYTPLNSFVTKEISNQETITVDRVIDGDTVEVNGSSFRLLGINTPEKKEYFYQEAKSFLEENVLNKSLTAEKQGKDLYDRELVYLYDGEKNINKEVVREGYANYYFPEGRDAHFIEFSNAWEECIESNKNLCEKSLNKCADCIELRVWDFESQKVVLYNNCNIDCNLNSWTIKDEGRKKFVFGDFNFRSKTEVSIIVDDKRSNQEILYWKNQTYVWTSTGDTIFLRDAQGKLVLWESQGY
jgi:endonuclease YncB( thermonuclease family)